MGPMMQLKQSTTRASGLTLGVVNRRISSARIDSAA